jgi:translation elongation factor EF-1alpha
MIVLKNEEWFAVEWDQIGRVKHYYSKIAVAIIELSTGLQVGEQIKIVGPKTETEQTVKSMQVDHQNINEAKEGDLVGLKVRDKVREGDTVYKFTVKV